MILSRRDLEEIGLAVINDFGSLYPDSHSAGPGRVMKATPIDQLAKEYLHLDVSYAPLSEHGRIYGLTAYADTAFQVEEGGKVRKFRLKRNQVLLDTSLYSEASDSITDHRCRFTLAHECAHQLLFQLESDAQKTICEESYSARRAYSFRELKNREDWNEWQANVLGAALLMPQEEMDFAMWRLAADKPLNRYGPLMSPDDRNILQAVSSIYGVSKTTAAIRLKELGYIEDHLPKEYLDPLEVPYEPYE